MKQSETRSPCPETPPCYACRKVLTAGDPFNTAYTRRGMPPGFEHVIIHAGNAPAGTPEGSIDPYDPRIKISEPARQLERDLRALQGLRIHPQSEKLIRQELIERALQAENHRRGA
jgi:hypothetical protein